MAGSSPEWWPASRRNPWPASIGIRTDVLIVAPTTRLALLEMRWGLVPDMAAFVLLPPLLRDDVFRELLFSARTVGAEEAVRLGLATRLADDPHGAAMAMASQMARSSRSALAAAKRLANHASHLLMEVLMAESAEQQRLIGSAEQRSTSATVLAGQADLANSP